MKPNQWVALRGAITRALIVVTVAFHHALAQGAAGPSGNQGGNAQIPKCDKPLGVMAVVEPQDGIQQALMMYKLPSPTGVLRLMLQQSNCFLVADRGMAMQNLMQERQLAAEGQLQQGSKVGGGQLVAADFLLTPTVVFSEGNSGGIAAATVSAVSPVFRLFAGGLKFKEAQTSLILTDARSGLQLATAEGKARKSDFALGGLVLGAASGGALGAYTNTNEGKVIVASFVDNYSRLVDVIRGDTSMQRGNRMLKAEAAAPPAPVAPPMGMMQEGDVLVAKIAGIKLMALPKDSAKVVGTLSKTDELVFLGKEQDGYVQVQGTAAMGWVRKLMVVKK